jgi:NADH-quinone oxidoreductase subunit L
MELSPQNLLVWIILLPLGGAIINGVFGKGAHKNLTTGVAVGTVFTAFLLSLYCFGKLLSAGHVEGEEHAAHTPMIVQNLYEWFQISVGGSSVGINVRFVMDHLSGIMTVMVTGIATLIHVYSSGYMGEDPGYRRFMTYLNLFTASMLVLVLASNLPLMFVGWEGVGLCSYLLIGFWWENPAYAAAGRKAFVVNRIGDFGVLLGAFLLVATVGSFEFIDINNAAARMEHASFMIGGAPFFGMTIATAAALFLFVGCTGKSAQLPLYVWLPDAMAGPTPVSALIHAATMVTAGVYLCCRLSPVFIHSETAMIVIALVGSATAFLGASIGLVQNQMKKILAYSTVSQLGFMFAAVGVGAFGAAFFHVFTHAFFKACLFLGAGSVMHAVHAHGDADIRYLGGMKKFMPRTHLTFLISCAAIAGFPLTSGFFSKDEILLGALESTHHLPAWVGYTVFVTLALTAFMTAFYMFRLYFRTFWGEFKGGHPPSDDHHGEHAEEHATPHESEDAITIPLMFLAFGAAVVGFLGLPHWLGELSWWGHFLSGHGETIGPVATWAHVAVEGAEAGEESVIGLGIAAMSVGTLVGLGGIGLAYVWYFQQDGSVPAGIRTSWPRLHSFLMDKWRVDELYNFAIIGPFKWVAVVAANIDRIAVDGLLTKVPGFLAKLAGGALSKLQSGTIYVYSTMFAVGAFGVVWWFTTPHVSVETTEPESGTAFVFEASGGPGYEYRWDFDSDGEFETDWSSERRVEHTYNDETFHGVVAVIVPPSMDGEAVDENIVLTVTEGAQTLPVNELAVNWIDEARVPEGTAATAPTIRREGGDVIVTPNSASLVVGAGEPATEEVHMAVGDSARLGLSTLRIATRARATVEVRNPFDNRAHQEMEVIVNLSAPLEVASVGGAR